jgi:hypothetical protein
MSGEYSGDAMINGGWNVQMKRRLTSEGMGRSQRWLQIEPPNAKLCVSAVNLLCAVQLNSLINKV